MSQEEQDIIRQHPQPEEEAAFFITEDVRQGMPGKPPDGAIKEENESDAQDG